VRNSSNIGLIEMVEKNVEYIWIWWENTRFPMWFLWVSLTTVHWLKKSVCTGCQIQVHLIWMPASNQSCMPRRWERWMFISVVLFTWLHVIYIYIILYVYLYAYAYVYTVYIYIQQLDLPPLMMQFTTMQSLKSPLLSHGFNLLCLYNFTLFA
jgi:hypothetical protein